MTSKNSPKDDDFNRSYDIDRRQCFRKLLALLIIVIAVIAVASMLGKALGHDFSVEYHQMLEPIVRISGAFGNVDWGPFSR